MKLKVIGWTYYEDCRFMEADSSYAARAAIIDDIRANGYEFTGWHHQESLCGVPVLNDGCMYTYSQRGWGDLMAEAHGHTGYMDYVYYAFDFPENEDAEYKLPTRDIADAVYTAAAETLSIEEREYLFEGDFTLRFPERAQGERGIYTLTVEEAEAVSVMEVVRQLPRVVCRRLISNDMQETYVLKEDECTIEADPARILVGLRDELRYIGKGDTVVVGDRSYIVKDVARFRKMPPELETSLVSGIGGKHDEAVKLYNKAEVIIEISI